MWFPQKKQFRSDDAALLTPLSPYLARLALCFPEHQDIIHSHRPFHISGENPALVLTFKYLDPHLYDLACNACPSHYLDDFSGNDLFFGCLAHLSNTLTLLFLCLQAAYRSDYLLDDMLGLARVDYGGCR
jgi:hypothetical protein